MSKQAAVLVASCRLSTRMSGLKSVTQRLNLQVLYKAGSNSTDWRGRGRLIDASRCGNEAKLAPLHSAARMTDGQSGFAAPFFPLHRSRRIGSELADAKDYEAMREDAVPTFGNEEPDGRDGS